MDNLQYSDEANIAAKVHELEEALHIDGMFRAKARAVFMAIYEERYLADSAYAEVLQDAFDIQTEAQAILGSTDVQ
jgi:hypothetical protein